MAKSNAADQLAGKGSIADKLRRRRLAIEAGDLEAAKRIAEGKEQEGDKQYGSQDDEDEDKKKKPKGLFDLRINPKD